MKDLNKILDHTDSKEQALIKAVIEAGAILLDYWPANQPDKGLNIQAKKRW